MTGEEMRELEEGIAEARMRRAERKVYGEIARTWHDDEDFRRDFNEQ